jgi:CarD family transcriptional regulator
MSINRFTPQSKVVFPSHGIGEIIAIESHSIENMTIPMMVVHFLKTKMTLRLPLQKALSTGLRSPVSKDEGIKILEELSKPMGKIKEKNWQKKRNIYEAKLNSGDLMQLTEVLRHLHPIDSYQNFSEKKIFETTIQRLSDELSYVLDKESTVLLEEILHQLDQSC